MDIPTLQKFHQLIEHQSNPSLSIYIPTEKAGRETQQNPVRFKNSISESETRLEEQGLNRTERDAFLKPLRELLGDREYWQNQECGLVIFLAEGLFETYRLPIEFEQKVVLDQRFHIKPLLPLFLENERFYLLAVSRRDLRLLVGTRFDLAEIELPDVPTSLEDALKFDDPERELHYQAGASGSQGEGAIYHGHHPEKNERANLKRYFHLVDRGLMAAIGDQSDPLVLAGLEELIPIYREVNSYGNSMEESILSNPDQLSLEDLHQSAWKIVEHRVVEARSKAIDRFYSLKNGKKAHSLERILPAAYHGRVDTLFVDLDREVWGMYDPQADSIELEEKAEHSSRDLVDLSVIHTLLNGGKVLLLPEEDHEVLEQSAAVAVFRY